MRVLDNPTTRKSFALLSLGAMLMGGLAGMLTRPQPASATPLDKPCYDPWINSAYRQIAGRDPIAGGSSYLGGKTDGECNVNFYGSGHWGNYTDLFNKVRTFLRIEEKANVAFLTVFGRLATDSELLTYSQQPERTLSSYISDLQSRAYVNTAERRATINRAYLAATGRAAGADDYARYQTNQNFSMYADIVRDVLAVLWSEPNKDTSEKVQVIRRAYAAAGLSPSNSDIYGVGGLIGGWVHGPAKTFVQQVAENKRWAGKSGGYDTNLASIPIPDSISSALSSALSSANKSAIVAQGGGNIVAQGGGNIVAQGGGNIILNGGGNIVAQGGGNIVAQGGLNIVAQGGGNYVPSNLSSLISNPIALVNTNGSNFSGGFFSAGAG